MKLLTLYIALFGATVSANYCVQDQCGRAVFGNPRGSKPSSSRRAECSSFFKYTSYPPPKTSTVTKSRATVITTQTISRPGSIQTSTVYPSPATFTDTVTPSPIGETITTRETTLSTSIFTPDPEVSTSTVSAEPEVVTTTSTSTSTETTTIASTTTIYYSNVNKRGMATATPKGTVYSPTRVPPLASACRGSSGYSSACSCLGGVQKTTVKGPCSTKTTTVSSGATTITRTVTRDGSNTTVTTTASQITTRVTTTAAPRTTSTTLTLDPTTEVVTQTGPGTTTVTTQTTTPPPSTVTQSTTTTETQRTTAVATRSVGPVCDTVSGASCACSYKVICDTQVRLGTANLIREYLLFNVQSCIEACDADFRCRLGVYHEPSLRCNIFSGNPSGATVGPNRGSFYFERDTPGSLCGNPACAAS